MIQITRAAGCEEIIELNEQASTWTPDNSNFFTISNMCVLFNCEVGLSDQVFGIGPAVWW